MYAELGMAALQQRQQALGLAQRLSVFGQYPFSSGFDAAHEPVAHRIIAC